MSKQSVLVFIEQNNNKIAEVSLELICKGCELAKQLGTSVEAVALSHNMKDELKVLGHYGCENVYYVDDKRLADRKSVV
jgi:electron transfer flavoprotein alpha subunit